MTGVLDLADLNQHSRLEVQPALVVVLDMIRWVTSWVTDCADRR